MVIPSGNVPVIELTLEEYDVLKKKEFVYDLEKSKIEKRVKDGSYVDDDTRLLYGVPSREDMNAEELAKALAKTRERLESEKANDKW